MSRRTSLVIAVALAGCGSADRHDPTTPADEVSACPSETAPERCRDLADAAERAGKGELAWAYTVLECESPTGAQCAAMWQRHAKLAPTQTDALNVLHVACEHLPAACERLAAWHSERGHMLAAAAYHKRSETPAPSRSANALALGTDLAATMHLSGAPRADSIAQPIGHELSAPVEHPAIKPKAKAWSMHAASQGASSDACPSKVMRDREQVSPSSCVTEVRPFDGDQIALLNHCSEAISVAYAGARADHSTYANQVRLEANEAHSVGISHRELGPLTYAACAGLCRVTGNSGDNTAWSGTDATYYCTGAGRP